MQQEIERVLRVIKEQQEALTEQTGVEPSLTDNEIKQYLEIVLVEVKKTHKKKWMKELRFWLFSFRFQRIARRPIWE